MGRFVKQVTLFVFVFSVILAAVVGILTILNKRLLEHHSLNNINTVFIGDSHMEMGLNDNLFPNSVNLGKSSDGYIHTYGKLRAVLEQNAQIRTVFLSYSAHNLSSYFHSFIDGRNARFGFADYFPILPAAEKIELLRRNKLLGIEALSLILKQGFSNLTADSSHQYSFLGRYSPRREQLEDTSTIIERINVQFYEHGKLRPFSSIQTEYLGKIIRLCSDRKIKLILIEMPVHYIYRNLVPHEYKVRFFSTIRNEQVLLMDCYDLHLPDNYFLPDGDHVNADGADSTTKFIYQKFKRLQHVTW